MCSIVRGQPSCCLEQVAKQSESLVSLDGADQELGLGQVRCENWCSGVSVGIDIWGFL